MTWIAIIAMIVALPVCGALSAARARRRERRAAEAFAVAVEFNLIVRHGG